MCCFEYSGWISTYWQWSISGCLIWMLREYVTNGKLKMQNTGRRWQPHFVFSTDTIQKKPEEWLFLGLSTGQKELKPLSIFMPLDSLLIALFFENSSNNAHLAVYIYQTFLPFPFFPLRPNCGTNRLSYKELKWNCNFWPLFQKPRWENLIQNYTDIRNNTKD